MVQKRYLNNQLHLNLLNYPKLSTPLLLYGEVGGKFQLKKIITV